MAGELLMAIGFIVVLFAVRKYWLESSFTRNVKQLEAEIKRVRLIHKGDVEPVGSDEQSIPNLNAMKLELYIAERYEDSGLYEVAQNHRDSAMMLSKRLGVSMPDKSTDTQYKIDEEGNVYWDGKDIEEQTKARRKAIVRAQIERKLETEAVTNEVKRKHAKKASKRKQQVKESEEVVIDMAVIGGSEKDDLPSPIQPSISENE
jgi:hypothetical protein